MKKRVLVLGAAAYNKRTITAIVNSGFHVCALDRNPNAPAFEQASESAAVDISDRAAVLAFAAAFRPDGIMPINEFAVMAACYATQKLGLRGPSYLTGIAGTDKGLMREAWSLAGVAQPKYAVFNADAESRDVLRVLSLPLVIKPTFSGGGGRGITIARTMEEVEDSLTLARKYALNGRIIAEDYIEGIEVTVDSLVWRGTVHPLAVSDKVKPESRFRVATSLNFPADFDGKTIGRIRSIVTMATEALGVSDGATHTELIVSHDAAEIRLVEMGIRGGGGHLFGSIIEEVSGVCAPAELARILCGDTPNLAPRYERGCVYRFFNPPGAGIIKAIRYDENVSRSDYVVDFGITATVGATYEGLVNSMHRVGFVVTRGRDRKEAMIRADAVENAVSFEIG